MKELLGNLGKKYYRASLNIVRGLKGLSLTRCLALLDPLDATAERERERDYSISYFTKM